MNKTLDVDLERAALKEKIQNHPLLRIEDKNERLKKRRLFLDFSESVLRYKNFYAPLQNYLDKMAPSSSGRLLLSESMYRDNVLNDKTHRAGWFDGMAFAQALSNAVKNYDCSRNVSFLTYFEDVYSKALVKEASVMARVNESNLLMTRDITLLKEIYNCIKDMPGESKELTPAQCENVANKLNENKKRSRRWTAELVYNTMQAAKAVLSIDCEANGDTDSEPQFQIAAPEDTSPSARVEEALFFSWFFCQLRPSQKSSKLCNQMRALMTNDVLLPLHPQNSKDEIDQADLYQKAFCDCGEKLYQNIFALSPLKRDENSDPLRYLVFLQWRDPETSQEVPRAELEQIETLCRAEPSLPLLDKTTANFFHVNNVSPARKLCNDLKQHLCKVWMLALPE
mgnify:FL=1